MPIVDAGRLRGISAELLRAAGATEEESEWVSRCLVDADLSGTDTHGVRLLPRYLSNVRAGLIRVGVEPEVVRETPSTALIDGRWGFGYVVARRAMEIAIEKARRHTISCVGAFNAEHCGRMASYPLMAAERGMLGMAAVNTRVCVAPFGGLESAFGTNPICVAAPGRPFPFLLDMATSVRAYGALGLSWLRGEAIPEGWAVDEAGRPLTDPAVMHEEKRGVLLPLGGVAGYKGYGLGLLVDILTGCLCGMGSSLRLPRWPEDYGEHDDPNDIFMICLDISKFVPLDEFEGRVEWMLGEVKKGRRAPGVEEILVPGEREFRTMETRLREGIPLHQRTWDSIVAAAGELGVEIESVE